MKAIFNSGIVTRRIGDPKLMHHDLPCQTPKDFRRSFCFVRNPVEWYASFWAYRMIEGWRKDSILDTRCKATNFEKFMNNVFEHCSSYVTQLYELFVGTEKHQTIDDIGRQENLMNDLVRILKQNGELFNEKKLRATPPENVGVEKPEYPMSLRKRVAENEKRMMDRFNYEP